MNRYRSARRNNSTAAAPIFAFLLIACFGLLFVTGCTSTTSDAEKTQDDTFTQEDVARFQQLAQGDDSSSAMAMSTASSATAQSSSDATMSTGVDATASLAAVDPALRKKYDSLRSSSSGKGSNVYRVTNAFLNVRGQPAVNAPFIARIDQGDLVTVAEFTNANWAKITLDDGKSGYVALRYISKLTTEEKLKEEQKVFDGLYFVNFAFVNVRSSPDTGAEKIGEIAGQAFVHPLSIDKEWARVPFENKEGYVSMQYLSPFRPNFLVRQDTYTLPILHYDAGQEGMIAAMQQHVAALKKMGVTFITFSTLKSTIEAQEVRDARLAPKSVILAITGLSTQNVKAVSDALGSAGIVATLFLQTNEVGISGISEKQVVTLQANGMDIQSAGHTGDDLRTLTNAQTRLELEQSRTMLEGITHKTVFAIAYPQGGANDRVLTQAADGGYLFGMGSAPDTSFTRDQFLRLPSTAVSPGMTAEDLGKFFK